MKIGVSSCLLGEKCRYDGEGSKDNFVAKELAKHFEFVTYCPETILFGTPRESLRLVDVDGEIVARTNKHRTDITSQLKEISHRFALDAKTQEISAFVFKSKSPTCGIERVKLYQNNDSNIHQKSAIGLFAQAMMQINPYLPIEDEGRLNDPWLRENFLMQVFAYGDLQKFLKSNPKMHDLVQFHTNYKYLIYAKSHQAYKKLGAIVANHDKKEPCEVLEEYRVALLESIALKGTRGKSYNVLHHIYGYLKNKLEPEEKEHILSSFEEYKEGIIPLIAAIKLLNLYIKKFDLHYLKEQKFLNPYPKELALRSDIKAYK